MKSSFVAASIFAALVLLAAPTSAASRLLLATNPPTASEVAASIKQWSRDVSQVNDFLNKAFTLADPGAGAAHAKAVALNEPVQLAILDRVQGLSADAQSAVVTLQTVYSNVPNDLQNIVDDPSVINVQVQVKSIDDVRCNSVLPALATLWASAASAAGLDESCTPTVPRPNACP